MLRTFHDEMAPFAMKRTYLTWSNHGRVPNVWCRGDFKRYDSFKGKLHSFKFVRSDKNPRMRINTTQRVQWVFRRCHHLQEQPGRVLFYVYYPLQESTWNLKMMISTADADTDIHGSIIRCKQKQVGPGRSRTSRTVCASNHLGQKDNNASSNGRLVLAWQDPFLQKL